MADVFISYSRKDIAFARLIYDALRQAGIEPWIDWQGIPAGEKWWKEICEAIKNSNVFMFIISQNSVGSPVCKDEINQALLNNKRIIPILVDDLKPEVIKEFDLDLPQINWVVFQKDHIFELHENPQVQAELPEDRQVALPRLPQFEEAFKKLSTAIRTDWDWVKYQTHLQVEASFWEVSSRNSSFLMRGSELEEAEKRLIGAAGKEPQPTQLQGQYVNASKQEEARRKQEELEQQQETLRLQQEKLRLQKKASQRQRLALWILGIGLAVAVVLFIFGWTQRDQYLAETLVRATAQSNAESAQATAVSESKVRATAEANAVSQANARATQEAIAVTQRNIALNRQLAAQALNTGSRTLDAGLLMAVEAAGRSDQLDVQTNLLAMLQLEPRLKYFIPGHPRGIHQIAVSPDGRYIATGTVEDTVILYDLSSGKPVGAPLGGPPSEVTAVAFSPDGKRLAAVCNDPVLYLWDVSDPNHPAALAPIFYQPVGEASTTMQNSDGRTLQVWTGRYFPGLDDLWNSYSDLPESQDFRAFSFGSFSLSFSPDGKSLALGGGDGTVRLLDMANLSWGEPISIPPRTTGIKLYPFIFTLSFSPDGKSIAGGVPDYGVAVWQVESGAMTSFGPCSGAGGALPRVVFQPDGQKIVYSCGENKLYTLDSKDNSLPQAQDTPGRVLSLAFTPDAKILAIGTAENDIILWDINTSQAIGEPLRAHNADVLSLAFTPDGNDLVSADWNHNLAVWGLSYSGGSERLSRQYTLPGTDSLFLNEDSKDLNFSPAGDSLAFFKDSNTRIAVLDLKSGQIVHERQVSGALGSLTSLPQANLLAWISMDGNTRQVVLADFQTLVESRTFPVEGSVFAFDSKQMRVAATDKSQVKLWDINTGQLLPQSLNQPDYNLSITTFSPDGNLVAVQGTPTKGNGSVLFLWRVDSGKVTSMPIFGSSSGTLMVAISPDNAALAYSWLDKNFSLCPITVEPVVCQTVTGHTTWINYLAFNAAGTMLVSSASDGSIRFWDTTGRSLGTLPNPEHFYSLAWSADDHWLAAAGSGNQMVVWHASLALWREDACRLAGRNLSLAEWQNYFPGQPYQKTCPGLPVHPSLIERFLVTQASLLANDQKAAALAAFAKDTPIDAGLLPEIEEGILHFSPQVLSLWSSYLAENQQVPKAMDWAREIKTLYGVKSVLPEVWNTVCWFGSLGGQAADALPFCEAAVQLDPATAGFVDSRGLARALLGDLKGAAQDFQVYVDWLKSVGQGDQSTAKERQAWIAALNQGQNPFDAATLEALRSE